MRQSAFPAIQTISLNPHRGRWLSLPGLGDYLYRKIGGYRVHATLARMNWQQKTDPPPALRILFSNRPDLAPPIRQGFLSSPHQLTFAEFTRENIAAHDLIVPLGIADILLLDEMRDLISGNAIPIPSRQSVSICDDKLRFRQTLTKLGFGSYLPGPHEPSGFPYMLKKRVDEWGKSCRIITTPDEELAQTAQITDPGFMTEEFIPGRDEYATHIMFRGGRIVSALKLRYRFMNASAIKGQDRTLSIHPCRFTHQDLFTDILSGIGFEGLCCFNYKKRAGKPVIMEINPRFGGSLGPFFFSFVHKAARH